VPKQFSGFQIIGDDAVAVKKGSRRVERTRIPGHVVNNPLLHIHGRGSPDRSSSPITIGNDFKPPADGARLRIQAGNLSIPSRDADENSIFIDGGRRRDEQTRPHIRFPDFSPRSCIHTADISRSGAKEYFPAIVVGRGFDVAQVPARFRSYARVILPLLFSGLGIQGAKVPIPGPNKKTVPYYSGAALDGGSYFMTPLELETPDVSGIE
jgi:hypothetical protein